MNLTLLPALNASLNTASALLLILGYLFIRQRAVTAHTICMLSACGTSTLFLISYLVYHFFHGVTPFPRHDWVRLVYFLILISHTILAVVIVPLVMVVLFFALRGKFDKHRAVARVTLPLWLYVSVTGVVVYWMLYHL